MNRPNRDFPDTASLPGTDRSEELLEIMRERVLVLDGATGTMLQARDLGPRDFGGEKYEGCNELLVATRPDVVLDVHRAYLDAGADIIETNTFGGTPIVLAEYGVEHRAIELNRLAAELARQAADETSTPSKPRFVAGSIGPTTKAISVTGGISFRELVATFAEQAEGLLEGGIDIFCIETCQDTRNTKAAVIAVRDVLSEYGATRPIVISGTIEPMGAMLGGQTADAFVASMAHAGMLAVGLNCATGPEFMTDHVRSIHEMASCAVSCFPNAGLPDEDGAYSETPDRLAAALERFVDHGWLNIVGGCCGTTEAHIAEIARMVEGKPPRALPVDPERRAFYTGIELVEATDDNRPLLVGERTNVIGSRKFRRLVSEESWEEAAEIGRRQVRGGAQIVDVCLQTTERDELADIAEFYERLIRTVKAPLMIDTTDSEAVELALTYSQGKAIVNSINLEDGEERFERVCPLLTRYGAAVVVGTIDDDPEQAQAFTRERKLEVARRSHRLLTGKYGVPETDIVFDPLTFPAATGDEAYIGGAVETIEGLRLIKDAYPSCRTVLGISNISFGLPPAAREVLNSVFLYECTRAGLDMAIVNTEKIERYASIEMDERVMAEDLLFNRPPVEVPGDLKDGDLISGAPADWRQQTSAERAAISLFHIARITEHFRGARRVETPVERLPIDERLARYVIDGTREGLLPDLMDKLGEGANPLDVINGPLMAGMTEVGRQFAANQLIVAEVLQSAESMKAAVSFLEGFMDGADTSTRGRLLLATVKGDVHDIGKNLVEIILKNNGFDVINLGIKVPPEVLVAACREHRPDAVGLSGLLVKSARQMVVTAEDLAAAGIDVPILVGGAALSERFTRSRIAPVYPGPVIYCAEAMRGLAAMGRVMDPAERRALAEEARAEPEPTPVAAGTPILVEESAVRSSKVSLDVVPIPPPEADRRVLRRVSQLREIWSYINPQMLYGKHLGLKGNFKKKLSDRDPKALSLRDIVKEVQHDAMGWMRVAAVWRFFEAVSDGNTMSLFEPGADEPCHNFIFPRQPKKDGLCLADYVLPPAGATAVSRAPESAMSGSPVDTRHGTAVSSAPGDACHGTAVSSAPPGALESALSANGSGRGRSRWRDSGHGRYPWRDTVALFVVGAGDEVRTRAELAKSNGEYVKSHAIQALAIETAEAAAEWLHRRLRELWGFPDPVALTMADRFAARYRGKRYSFGYPACPDLDDQQGLFELLKPEEIGVQLTEGMMMDPEASVSALVFHHPDCKYFSATGTAR